MLDHGSLGVSDPAWSRAFHLAGLAAGGRGGGTRSSSTEHHRARHVALVIDPAVRRIEAARHGTV